jgi:streptogramin lyase
VIRGLSALALVAALMSATSAAAEPAPTDLVKAGAKTIPVGSQWLTVGYGGVWARTRGSKLVRIDPLTGRVVKTIHVPQGLCEDPVAEFGAIWSSTCGKDGLARIDPKTNTVRWAPLPKKATLNDGGMIGAGAGTIWLMLDGDGCSACELARINPKTMQVVAMAHVADGSTSVRFGYGYAWLANPFKNTVQQVDPRKNAVVGTATVHGAVFLAVGEGAVWVLGDSPDVTRIDARRGTIATVIHAGVVNERGYGDIVTGAGWLWVRGEGYLLTRIDPKTNKVVKRYGPSIGGGSVAVGYGAVWVGAGPRSYRLRVSNF